jgi:hypothetical protein
VAPGRRVVPSRRFRSSSARATIEEKKPFFCVIELPLRPSAAAASVSAVGRVRSM